MIIFEGKEIILHQHKGETDYIIITFMGAFESNKAHYEFFLKKVVEKYNISCLGFTTTTDHYYLHDDMNEMIALCNEISKDYKKIIIIGLSMGGYAALKYSKQLNADTVLAMTPRCTLDSDIRPLPKSATATRTLPQEVIKHSTIYENDIQGKIYLVYDPGCTTEDFDVEHIDYLYKLIPQAILVPVYHTGHITIHHLKGSEFFKSIIDALVQGDDQNIIKTITYIKRHHIVNVFTKAQRFMTKYTLLTYKMLTSSAFEKVKNHQLIQDDYCFRLKLCYWLNVKGYQKESSDYLKSIFFYHTQNIPYANQQLMSLPPYPYLINYNGYYLGYNFVTKKLKAMLNIGETAYCLPLQIYEQNGRVKIICIQNNIIFELKYGEDQDLFQLALLSDSYTPDHVKLSFSGYNIFIHQTNKKYYIGIQKFTGALYYTSTSTKEWEAFTPISMNIPIEKTCHLM